MAFGIGCGDIKLNVFFPFPVIDDQGNQLVAQRLITTDAHLHRGDDAFLFDGKAGWMTGTATTKQLHLHLVDESLAYEIFTY